MKDAIPIPAEKLNKPRAIAVSHQIEEKYCNRVLLDTGLCICLYELVELGDGLIYQSDASVHVRAEFMCASILTNERELTSERERKRQRVRARERDRETDRQTDRDIDRQTDEGRDREGERERARLESEAEKARGVHREIGFRV